MAAERSACAGIAEPKLVWIPPGQVTLGKNPRYREEGPERTVALKGFWMSQTEVTNAQFARFVAATGYRTAAEKPPRAIAGASPEMLEAGSAVFRLPTRADPNWWAWVPGANWRAPSGPGSSIEGQANLPVVHVTYDDARAYAQWAGLSLPSEEQWEYAARAGEAEPPEPRDAQGRPTANFYQGVFPTHDLGEDGYRSRAPVGCFEANGFKLYDMIGNVWEWTSSNAGSSAGSDAAPSGADTRIIKGGSYLCAANYCARYRPAARQFQERDLGTDHIGFRVVDNLRAPPAKR